MILFALTSDIKQSTDYADLDSLLYGISNGCLLYTSIRITTPIYIIDKFLGVCVIPESQNHIIIISTEIHSLFKPIPVSYTHLDVYKRQVQILRKE